MNSSRTKNVSKNAIIGLVVQLIRIIIEFVIRTIFIKSLGSEYLGINGLFTNVLTILSFAELGIGNAIVFSMYKEIANDNIDKIKSLMNLYKNAYLAVGFIILITGLMITPFITFFINDKPNISDNIYFIYLLFLSNTVVSYFFAYKKAIISAYQKEYIISVCKLISEIVKAIFQIFILLILKNFILYLIIQILCTVIDNLLATYKANKMFPFLNEKDYKKIEQVEKCNIFKNVKSLIVYKFGSIILNGTDNIIISKMLNLTTVGIVSNFNLILTTITTLVSSILNGFIASIGNLNANGSTLKQENIMKSMLFLSTWIYGFCMISFIILSNDFITIWLGKQFMLPFLAVIAMGIQLYVNGTQFAGYSYRTTMGLFNRGKWCPAIAAVINIILSVAFCYKLGVAGIIFATSFSRLTTTTWYDIYMVYKIKFKKSPLVFYLQYIKYFLTIIIVGFITFYFSNLIEVISFGYFLLKMSICIIVPNLLFILIFFKTKEFKDIFSRIKSLSIK